MSLIFTQPQNYAKYHISNTKENITRAQLRKIKENIKLKTHKHWVASHEALV